MPTDSLPSHATPWRMPRRRPPAAAISASQQFAHARTDAEVAAADDALGHAARSVSARRAHRRDAVDELDLAQRRHLGRAALAVHRAAFEEDGRHDVVSAADIGQELGQQIAAALRRVPEMVVRVDDRQVRLQRRFSVLRQPCLQCGVVADGGAAEFAFGVSELGHACFLLWCLFQRTAGSVSATFRRAGVPWHPA